MGFLAPALPLLAQGYGMYRSKRAADKAAGAATQASETEARASEEALEYLKGIDELPQELKQDALRRLGGLYGLEGGIGSQQDLIKRAIASPLYKEIMGGLDVGTEAILRSAAATGGLRSGGSIYDIGDYGTRLQNRALLESYNQQLAGLTGLSGLPTNEAMIAQIISGIGETRAAGQIGAAQAKQAGEQGLWNALPGLFGAGANLYDIWKQGRPKGLTPLQEDLVTGTAKDIVGDIRSGEDIVPGEQQKNWESWVMWSDRRLKKNIKVLGEIKGFNWCSFEWNSIAEKLGLKGNTYGIMADEVFEKVPDAVILKDGFLFVLYNMLYPLGEIS